LRTSDTFDSARKPSFRFADLSLRFIKTSLGVGCLDAAQLFNSGVDPELPETHRRSDKSSDSGNAIIATTRFARKA
jgi:hypothetical protein